MEISVDAPVLGFGGDPGQDVHWWPRLWESQCGGGRLEMRCVMEMFFELVRRLPGMAIAAKKGNVHSAVRPVE